MNADNPKRDVGDTKFGTDSENDAVSSNSGKPITNDDILEGSQ